VSKIICVAAAAIFLNNTESNPWECFSSRFYDTCFRFAFHPHLWDRIVNGRILLPFVVLRLWIMMSVWCVRVLTLLIFICLSSSAFSREETREESQRWFEVKQQQPHQSKNTSERACEAKL